MLRRHFGLGTAALVDEVEVRWPGGAIDRLRNIQANQRVTVVEGEGQRPSP
jgi:enediyne biosynthesis protein E4